MPGRNKHLCKRGVVAQPGMTGKIRALVLTGYGLNCDLETAHAFELAGAEAVRVHINALIDGSARLDDYQILAFGGGFTWGANIVEWTKS